jgi:hypothetical protein
MREAVANGAGAQDLVGIAERAPDCGIDDRGWSAAGDALA